MGIVAGIGWIALAYMGTVVLPATALDKLNETFTYRVDNNQSCFERIGGVPGLYGKPSDYSLTMACLKQR